MSLLSDKHYQTALAAIGLLMLDPRLLVTEGSTALIIENFPPSLADIFDLVYELARNNTSGEPITSLAVSNAAAGDSIPLDLLNQCIAQGNMEAWRAEEVLSELEQFATLARRARILSEGSQQIHLGTPIDTVETAIAEGRYAGTTKYNHDAGTAITEFLNADPPKGISTGNEWLDDELGGLMPNMLVGIAGRYKGGKTRLKRFIVMNALLNGASISEFDAENNWRLDLLDLTAMLASHYLYISGRDGNMTLSGMLLYRLGKNWRKLPEVTQEAIHRANQQIKRWADENLYRLYTREPDHGGITDIYSVDRLVRLDVMRHEARLITGDHLLLFAPKGGDNLVTKMAAVAQTMMTWTKQLPVTTLMVMQRNEAANNDDLDLSRGAGVKGGGDTPAALDTLLAVAPDFKANREAKELGLVHSEMDLIIQLSRFGGSGQKRQVVNRSSGYIIGDPIDPSRK